MSCTNHPSMITAYCQSNYCICTHSKWNFYTQLSIIFLLYLARVFSVYWLLMYPPWLSNRANPPSIILQAQTVRVHLHQSHSHLFPQLLQSNSYPTTHKILVFNYILEFLQSLFEVIWSTMFPQAIVFEHKGHCTWPSPLDFFLKSSASLKACSFILLLCSSIFSVLIARYFFIASVPCSLNFWGMGYSKDTALILGIIFSPSIPRPANIQTLKVFG